VPYQCTLDAGWGEQELKALYGATLMRVLREIWKSDQSEKADNQENVGSAIQ
jgi:hypothetical protein